MMEKSSTFASLMLLAAIYSAAWILQDQLFLNGDVSYILHASRLLLQGGSYTQDFFNPNPPLILYLQLPVIWAQQWLHGNLITEFRVYIFLLATLSLSLCFSLLRGNFLFIAAIAALLLIFPLYHFGQREHLLFILSLPYLLLLALRLQGGSPAAWQALVIGLLAGIGFALKPPFLLVPLLLELYYLYSRRSLRSCLRVETLTLLGFLLLYTVSLFIFQRDFLTNVLPFALRNYYASVGSSWVEMLLYPGSLFCFAVVLFYVVTLGDGAKSTPRDALLIGLLGFLAAFFAQQTTFFYHILPAFSLACLILLLLIPSLLSSHRIKAGLGFLLLVFAFLLLQNNYAKGQEYKTQVLDKLSLFLQTQKPSASVYVFARWGTYNNPVLQYSGNVSAQRFDCLWPVIGFMKTEQASPDKDLFINMIAEDFHRHQPDLVLVDSRDQSLLALDPAFNYPDYFSQNPRFHQEWKAYQYLTTLDEYPLYRLEVYQRSSH